VLLAEPHHGGSGARYRVLAQRERRHSMCGSMYEREQWERERREARA